MSMKKIVLAVMLCFGSAPFLQAQRVVWDIACMETLIANHKVQHASFQNMKENEAQIATFNQQIASVLKMTGFLAYIELKPGVDDSLA